MSLLFSLFVILVSPGFSAELKNAASGCTAVDETKFIRGNSMDELFTPEQPVTAKMGYYSCQPLSRGDIVLVDVTGRARPIIKLAQVVPGDRFHLAPIQNRYRFFVNGTLL